MKRTQWALSVALTAILSGDGIMAQDTPPDTGALFQRLDKNSDGKLTKDEIADDQARFFERLVRLGDKNLDGALTREEFAQANKPEERPNVPLGGGNPEQARADARQRFDMIDRNKDGKVTLDEVPEPMRDRLKPIFDRTGKQELTFEEFSRLAGGGGRPEPGELFKRFDTNSDGKLSREELPAELRERMAPVFERAGKNELTLDELSAGMRDAAGARLGNPDEMFGRLDTNGDGKLTVEEAPERARPMLEATLRRAGKEQGGSLSKDEFVKNFQPPREGARPEGDRPREERRPEGDKPREGTPRPEGDRPRDGERRPEGARPDGDRSREGNPRPEGDRPRDGERRPEGARPDGDRPREGNPRPEGDRPRDGERRPEGDRPREERRPEGDRPPGERRADGRPMEGRGGPAIFRLLDTNHDGKLSKEELAKASEHFGELDRNQDGQLDPSELFGGPPGPPDGRQPREGAGTRDGNPRGDARRDGDRPEPGRGPDGPAEGRGAFFQRLDKNGDGKLSKEEVPEPMKDRFSMLDTNGDGFVSQDELRAGAQQLGDRLRNRNPEGRPEAPKRD